jgi:hypothetical protein
MNLLSGTVGNMKALFAQKALYSASPILPQAAFPALPARGGYKDLFFFESHAEREHPRIERLC